MLLTEFFLLFSFSFFHFFFLFNNTNGYLKFIYCFNSFMRFPLLFTSVILCFITSLLFTLFRSRSLPLLFLCVCKEVLICRVFPFCAPLFFKYDDDLFCFSISQVFVQVFKQTLQHNFYSILFSVKPTILSSSPSLSLSIYISLFPT